MIALILILSIPITNLLSNIVAAWLEPQLQNRKKLIFFLFVIFSFIGGFLLYYFDVSYEIKKFVDPYTTTTNSTNNDIIYVKDTTAIIKDHSKEILSDTTTIKRNILLDDKIDPQRLLALKQPIGVKIIGWLFILALPILIVSNVKCWFISTKNFSTANSYSYFFWDWFFDAEGYQYNKTQNRFYREIGDKYREIGWYCFASVWFLIFFLIYTYKFFTPSMYAVETLKSFFLFMTFLGKSIVTFLRDLISPLFY